MEKKVDLASFNIAPYYPGSMIKRILWFFCGNIFINSYLPLPMSFKKSILKLFGATIGENFTIKMGVNIKYPWFLNIGKNVWMGEGVFIDNFLMVTIENNVCISQNAMLLTGNHDYSKSSFNLIAKEIYICEGAWIGAKTVVCPNVKVGSHAVLTVGSIATADLEAYTIYQGNPAKALRKRTIK